ncbi:lipid phosphate phosphatase 2-like [Iris pallida]|uniref:Lipid phosphate phosphatase 2-like n=1 Tax=Iris pallida TaxID=29817 RepID=A0AAX6DP14_IRIPA|nr:lipid phosphate phosphatase 2-like [Iris pallida]
MPSTSSSSLLIPLQRDNTREIQLGSHTLQSHGVKLAKVHMHDWIILIFLLALVVSLNAIHPFHRFVGKDMMADLKYPLKSNTVPVWAVPMIAVLLPIAIFVGVYFRRRDVYDLHHAILGILFSVLIAGVITDAIKDAVGRPRPDFFWRCFPQGKEVYDQVTGDVICNGDKNVIKEGYKSFPSGHTSWSDLAEQARLGAEQVRLGPNRRLGGPIWEFSVRRAAAWADFYNTGSDAIRLTGSTSARVLHNKWAKSLYLSYLGSFAGLGFIALYLSGKIEVFDRKGHVAKLCVIFLPLLVASLIGISRVDDYWHHWQDVFAGSLIGSVVATFCYLQFFPPPYHADGWGPYEYFRMLEETRAIGNATLSTNQQTEASTNSVGLAGSHHHHRAIVDELESGRN